MSIAKITITQTFDITEETIEKAVEAFLDNYDYGDSACINATYLGFIADQLIDSGNSQMDEMWKVVIFEKRTSGIFPLRTWRQLYERTESHL